MKTVLIAVRPRCHCREIHIQQPNWKEQLRELIRARSSVTFQLRDLSGILEMETELDDAGYEHQILSSDCQCHFLVLTSSTT